MLEILKHVFHIHSKHLHCKKIKCKLQSGIQASGGTYLKLTRFLVIDISTQPSVIVWRKVVPKTAGDYRTCRVGPIHLLLAALRPNLQKSECREFLRMFVTYILGNRVGLKLCYKRAVSFLQCMWAQRLRVISYSTKSFAA